MRSQSRAWKLDIKRRKNSEYDQEIPQSPTADNPVAPQTWYSIYSVYPLLNALQTRDCDVIFCVDLNSVISDVIQKVQRHHDLVKVTCREMGNVY